MRNQPALQTSTGGIWLGLGAVLTIVVLVVLVPMLALNTVIAGAGVGLVVLLFVALVVTRFATQPGRRRLTTMATLFGGIAFVGLVTAFVVSSIEANALR
ncbi:putative membrane protein [Okibacterium sp. HSC-33S16]|uniref:hypothetical protein n=1 Tax=Okibacterium sp. HSC-33S16 TaxID=2910965 RepID=UPI0020A0B6E1|nr:hypothetical protein [Okibacterium sp. HSC-33S16]MCP2030470.1 putative membrane protein [Okibacterium sp. HSC-33S16]